MYKGKDSVGVLCTFNLYSTDIQWYNEKKDKRKRGICTRTTNTFNNAHYFPLSINKNNKVLILSRLNWKHLEKYKKEIRYNCWVFEYLDDKVLGNLIPGIDKFITYSIQYKNHN